MIVRQVRRLWHDQHGTLEAASWLLLTSMIALGGVVGISTLRDQVVQQFGDLAVALESLDQSYSFSIVGPSATISGMYADPPTTLTDPADAAPACIEIEGVSASNEG